MNTVFKIKIAICINKTHAFSASRFSKNSFLETIKNKKFLQLSGSEKQNGVIFLFFNFRYKIK